MTDYTVPPLWLANHVQDPRITVGEYTYFDRHISLDLLYANPDDWPEEIEIKEPHPDSATLVSGY